MKNEKVSYRKGRKIKKRMKPKKENRGFFDRKNQKKDLEKKECF